MTEGGPGPGAAPPGWAEHHERVAALTNDALLKRNVIVNLVAWALPAVAALVSIPILAREMGASRFGLLSLAWAAVGMFSLFDFGLGRALTRLVAERLARGHEHDLADLIWAAGWLLLGLTAIVAAAGVWFAPHIVDRFLHVPPGLRTEAIGVITLLSLSIPPLAHGVALRGVLEAGQRFPLAARLRVPLGVATYAGPLLAIPFGSDARIAVGIIMFARVVYWLAHFWVLRHIVPRLHVPRIPPFAIVRELVTVGGWITVSNIVSPVLVQADRVMVAVSFPIAASGWYGVAIEAATKQWLFTAALQPVFFSALAASFKHAPERAVQLMERASNVTMLVLFPASLILAGFAHPLLHLWMGPAYAPQAAEVLRWLAIAVFVNALAQVPYSMLQGGVDARASALLHLVELPIYLAVLVLFTRWWGIEGVAFAWLARMAGDAIGQWWALHRQFPAARAATWRIMRLAVPATGLLVVAALLGA